MTLSQMPILPEVIRASWLCVMGGGKDLGDVGAEAGVKVRNDLLLVAVFGGQLVAREGCVECGGRVFRTQVLAGDGDLPFVIDEDLYSGDGTPLFRSMVTPLRRRPKRERAVEGFKDRV